MSDLIIIVLLLAALVYVVVIYNRLVRERQLTRSGWSDIGVQLKRRHDLIPKLVDAVSHYANFEKNTLERVTALRSQAAGVQNPARQNSLEGDISRGLGSIFALQEAYPDLKANQSFLQLQNDISTVEADIQFARRYYNGAVRDLNTRVESFPDLLLARLFAFEPAEYFEFEESPAQMTFQRLLAMLALVLLSLPVVATEYIESFHSDIEIHQNGDLLVTETIRVHAEGKQIRRGIYRDFPTRYKDARDRPVTVDFELLAVQRDRKDEPFHIKNLSNGIRIYMGDSNVYLSPGFYTYRIRYRTSRQIGFFDDFDELYWNVTGNGWTFEIRRASARVTLPGTADRLTLSGYTGKQGSTSQQLDFRRIDDRRAYFESRTALAPYEGLTIVAAWPKGLVREPSAAQRRAWFIEDHKASIVIFAGTLVLFAYYLLLWRWCGRDPAAGVIIPRYRPPSDYSPASMRFIERMGYDKACFTTAIINLAVKGAIEIDDNGGDFKLVKTGLARTPLAAGEREVLEGLFAAGRSEIDIERSNHSVLSKAISQHKKSLKRDYEKKYFNTNSWLIVPGVLASAVLAVVAIASLPSEEVIMKALFLGIFTMAPLMIIYTTVSRVLRMGRNGIFRYGIFLLPMAIFFGFFFTFGFPYVEFAQDVPVALVIGLVAMLAMHYFFYQWLKAPTLAGRRLLDQVEGFKHYLQVAEEDEIALQDAPEFSTEIYETYLPYAIALDLENEWSAKLNRAIAAGTVDRSYSHPNWYHARGHPGSRFSSALANSFNTAIAASSVAPGSSSGSSGGSSGGGGGGGGGGGW